MVIVVVRQQQEEQQPLLMAVVTGSARWVHSRGWCDMATVPITTNHRRDSQHETRIRLMQIFNGRSCCLRILFSFLSCPSHFPPKRKNMQRTRYQQTTVLSGAPRNPQRVLLSYPGKKEIKKKAIRVRWEAVDLCDGGREARLPTIYLASLICGRKHQTMTTDKRRARTSPFVCCIASPFPPTVLLLRLLLSGAVDGQELYNFFVSGLASRIEPNEEAVDISLQRLVLL